MLQPSRRGLATGLASLIAVPAIVRAGSLMPVRAVPTAWPRAMTGSALSPLVREILALIEQHGLDYALNWPGTEKGAR